MSGFCIFVVFTCSFGDWSQEDRSVRNESGEIRESEALFCPVWCLLSDEPLFDANGAESNVLSLFHHFDRFQTASWDTCKDVES